MSSFDADEAAPIPPVSEERPRSESPLFTDEAWGSAARGVVLLVLLGMALTVTLRLSLGDAWRYDLLKKNDLPMHDRMVFILQMVGVGVGLGLGAVTAMLVPKLAQRFPPSTFEAWMWFLSPLILLPAPIVIMQHEVWRGRHEELLPIILFGGMLAEFFVHRSIVYRPALVDQWVRRLWDSDTKHAAASPPSERAADETIAGASAPAAVDSSPGKSRTVVPGLGHRALAYVRNNQAFFVVIAAGLAYGIFMSIFTVRWHHKLGTAIFDLGINNNLLFGGLHGHFNESSVIFPEDPAKYLANHVKWGIYSFLPIYVFYPKAETLLVIQSVSMGLGAIPLYLFCKDRLPKWWAAAIAICYLCYYPMHGANFYEMKLVPTAAAFVLMTVWLIDTKRYVWGGIFFLWTMIMREDLPVPLAVVGAVFLLSGRRPFAGLIMTVVAATWFVFLRFRFMNDVGSWWFPNMYKDLWAAPERGFQGVVKTLISNPAFTLKHIFVEKKFWYLMHLLVPLMFLPVRRWYGWAALVPGAILTLLVTDYAPPLMFSFQYVMVWAPYLFLAGAVVLAHTFRLPDGRPRAQAALIAMCLTSAGLSYNYGAFAMRDKALKSGYHKITFDFDEKDQARYRDLQALLKTIPEDATLAATEHVGAHLSSRVGFFTLRRGSHDVTYIVAAKDELSLGKTRRSIYRALQSKEYGLQGRFGEFLVLKKGAPTDKNDEIIDEWHLKRGSRKSRSDADDEEDDDEDEDEDDNSGRSISQRAPALRNENLSKEGDGDKTDQEDDEPDLDEEDAGENDQGME